MKSQKPIFNIIFGAKNSLKPNSSIWSLKSPNPKNEFRSQPIYSRNKLLLLYCSSSSSSSSSSPDDCGSVKSNDCDEPIDAGSSIRKPISLWPGMYHSPVTNALWEARSNLYEPMPKSPINNNNNSKQQQLIAKPPSKSRTSVVYKFSTDYVLREQYRNPWNRMRMGKLVEDLDALAGTISFKVLPLLSYPLYLHIFFIHNNVFLMLHCMYINYAARVFISSTACYSNFFHSF